MIDIQDIRQDCSKSLPDIRGDKGVHCARSVAVVPGISGTLVRSDSCPVLSVLPSTFNGIKVEVTEPTPVILNSAERDEGGQFPDIAYTETDSSNSTECSIIDDDSHKEMNVQIDNRAEPLVFEQAGGENCVHYGIKSELFESNLNDFKTETKRINLLKKIDGLVDDIIRTRSYGIYGAENQKGGFKALYNFVANTISMGKNPSSILLQKVRSELIVLSDLVDGENYTAINRTIDELNADDSISAIIKKASVNDYFHRLYVLSGNIVDQVVSDYDSPVDNKTLEQLKDLLSIYLLKLTQVKINPDDIDLYKNNSISLYGPMTVGKPVWRRSLENILSFCLNGTGMLALHLTYWILTITHSREEGFFTNNFPYEQAVGLFMTIYCALSVLYGSSRNTISIIRAEMVDPDWTWWALLKSGGENVAKDISLLVSNALAVSSKQQYVPIPQSINLLVSTDFARRIPLRVLDVHRAGLKPWRVSPCPLIYIFGATLTSASIILPHIFPDGFAAAFGYQGNNPDFSQDTWRSVISNLLTASGVTLAEINRICVLTSLYLSGVITTQMIGDIYYCDNAALKRKLSSYLPFFLARYLITGGITVLSIIRPLIPDSRHEETVRAVFVASATANILKSIFWEDVVKVIHEKLIEKRVKANHVQSMETRLRKSMNHQGWRNVDTIYDYLKLLNQALDKIGYDKTVKAMHDVAFRPDLIQLIRTNVSARIRVNDARKGGARFDIRLFDWPKDKVGEVMEKRGSAVDNNSGVDLSEDPPVIDSSEGGSVAEAQPDISGTALTKSLYTAGGSGSEEDIPLLSVHSVIDTKLPPQPAPSKRFQVVKVNSVEALGTEVRPESSEAGGSPEPGLAGARKTGGDSHHIIEITDQDISSPEGHENHSLSGTERAEQNPPRIDLMNSWSSESSVLSIFFAETEPHEDSV